jgi:hypothetical protein
MKSNKKKIEIQPHWAKELVKLRCWINGFQAGRKTPGVINLDNYVPGEDALRQIIMAIDEEMTK